VTPRWFPDRRAPSVGWLDAWWIDVKLGARMLIKYPGLTLVGGTGIAAAIAISTASFAFFYAYLYSTLPVEEGARVVALENWDVDANNESRQALHDYLLWRDEMSSMEEIGAFRTIGRNLIVPGGVAEPVRLAEITPSGFRIARVQPLLGRALLDEDERPGAAAVVVIGHDVWQSRFASDRSVVGREVRLGHTPHTIVGVMPAGFEFPVNHSYWVPLRADPASFARGEGPAIFIFGRLAPAATMESAQAELTTIGARSAAAYPKTHAKLRARVLPYAYPILDIQDVSLAQVAVMQAIVSVLLIVVAVNVAVLIYARTATRQGEIAVRTAMGATRGRIVTQLFIEALVLSGVSAAAGLGLAKLGLGQAHAIMGLESARPPYWIEYGLTPAAIAYIVGLAVLAAAIAGVLPALNATGRRVEATLRRLGGGTGMRLGATWTVLIVAQVAFAVAALPITAALAWSEIRPTTTAPVFAVEQFLAGVLAMDPEPPPGGNPAAYRRDLASRFQAVQADVIARLEREFWVSDVTVASRPPGEEGSSRVEVEGPAAAAQATREVRVNAVGLDFFEAFDARLLTGRPFSSADLATSSAASAVRAVIVNRAFADRILGGASAVGRRVRVAPAPGTSSPDGSPWHEIVGVVGDLHVNAIDPSLVEPVLYQPLTSGQAAGASLVLRVSGGAPGTYADRLREITTAVDPTVRVVAYPLIDIYRQENVAKRLVAAALALVVTSVLLLSAGGIYALMSFTVAQRRKEIGIRAALGAEPRRILRSIFARAAGQLALGISVGISAALAIDALSGGEMIGGAGVVLLPAMCTIMLGVGLVASIGPARRGLRVQPTEALRED
jgi:predicted permease